MGELATQQSSKPALHHPQPVADGRPTPIAAIAATAATAPAADTRWVTAEGHRLALRTLQVADAPLLGALWDGGLSPQSRRNRFHGGRGRFTPLRLLQAADLQPALGMALAITRLLPGGVEELLAEGRWVRHTAGAGTAEFALAVADGWQGQGLGRRLLLALVHTALQQQVQTLTAQVLPGNGAMQALLQRGGLVPHRTGTSNAAATACEDPCWHYHCQPAVLAQRLQQLGRQRPHQQQQQQQQQQQLVQGTAGLRLRLVQWWARMRFAPLRVVR